MVSQMSTTSAIGNAASVSKGNKKYSRGKYKKMTFNEKVQRAIRSEAERKEILASVGVTLTATQSLVQLINGIGAGTSYNQRVGLEVTHCYVEIDLGIFNQTVVNTSSNSGDFGFWAVVLDRQPNGATPAFGDIFDDSLAIGHQGTDFRITTTNQDRFKVVSRNEWAVGFSGNITAGNYTQQTGASPYHVKEFIDLSKLWMTDSKDQKANYSGTASNVTAIDSGALWFVVASSQSTANVNTIVVGQFKYRFVDV